MAPTGELAAGRRFAHHLAHLDRHVRRHAALAGGGETIDANEHRTDVNRSEAVQADIGPMQGDM